MSSNPALMGALLFRPSSLMTATCSAAGVDPGVLLETDEPTTKMDSSFDIQGFCALKPLSHSSKHISAYNNVRENGTFIFWGPDGRLPCNVLPASSCERQPPFNSLPRRSLRRASRGNITAASLSSSPVSWLHKYC